LTLERLADRMGISRSRVAEIERGKGDTTPLSTWVKIGLALGRPLALSFSRSMAVTSLSHAGHLAAQALVLRLARGLGRRASFELAIRPYDPAQSIDVCVRDDRRRTLDVIEIFQQSYRHGGGGPKLRS